MSLDTLPEPLTQLQGYLAALDIEQKALEKDRAFYPASAQARLAELADQRDQIQQKADQLENQ